MKLLKAFLGFALLMVSGSALAEVIPGVGFTEEIEARDENKTQKYFLGIDNQNTGYNGALGILAINNHAAAVDVAGAVTSSGLVGVYAEAYKDGEITCNLEDVSSTAGAGVTIWSGALAENGGDPESVGTVTMTVNNVTGKSGVGIETNTEGSVTNFTANGNVVSNGGNNYYALSCTNRSATNNIAIYGNLQSAGLGLQLETSGEGAVTGVLVTGTISGKNSISASYGDKIRSTVTVWKLEKADNGSYVVANGYADENDAEEFAKNRINYIIKHADNITPLTATGDALPKSHGYSVAKEGERVTIQLNGLGVYIKKAFNNGVEITEKDKNDRFYVTVERGGGIDLTVETAPVLACDDVESQIGKPCNNGIAGTCFMSGTYECNPATGKIECKLVDDVDGRIEFCGNNVDDDCDGVVDEKECIDVPALDTDGDGVPDSEDVCPNDPLNSTVMPIGGCFVNGSNIPERYDPKVPTDVIANPKTKVLPPFVLRDGNKVNVYYERFAGGVFKVGDTKLGKTKYEVMLKTKLKKKKATSKIVKQALTKNYRTIKLKKGATVTAKYRVTITKKVGKKSVTKRTKWSKAEKIQYLPIK